MNSLRLAAFIALVCVGCSRSGESAPEPRPDKTDVTAKFLGEVGGKSFGEDGIYHFTKDGRFIKKVTLKAIFGSEDLLENGDRIGAGGTLDCNFIVNAKIDRVIVNEKLPSWDLGLYEVQVSDEVVTPDESNPFSNSPLGPKLSRTVCAEHFKKSRIVDELKIPNQYMESFSSSSIQWARGQILPLSN